MRDHRFLKKQLATDPIHIILLGENPKYIFNTSYNNLWPKLKKFNRIAYLEFHVNPDIVEIEMLRFKKTLLSSEKPPKLKEYLQYFI